MIHSAELGTLPKPYLFLEWITLTSRVNQAETPQFGFNVQPKLTSTRLPNSPDRKYSPTVPRRF